jgi:dihydropteroate synthase
MGILNVTPDSFSDGGKYSSLDKAIEQARALKEQGADIIDIGGQSTRPGSVVISEEEELERVIPIIKAIRESDCEIPISIDTFRANVAVAAVKAGADLINDVSGGLREPDGNMFRVMGELATPVCLMHMRGTSSDMSSPSNTTYSAHGLVYDVEHELSRCVQFARAANIPRWNIIIDPGFGFSKLGDQNIHLLNRLSHLTSPTSLLRDFPLLVGLSRKSFIGNITQCPQPDQRQIGTSVACAAAISQGANVLRVHDVKDMVECSRMADALWRKVL